MIFSQGKKENVTLDRAGEEFYVPFRVGGNTARYQQTLGRVLDIMKKK